MPSHSFTSNPRYPVDALSHDRDSGEATQVVALRYLPVGLSILLSILSILWLTAFHHIPGLDEFISEGNSDKYLSGANQGLMGETQKQGSISPVFTEEIQHWNDEILKWSSNFSLDPNLVAVVMQIESCGHPEIQSPTGALGLFQVMPFHFKEGEQVFDPSTNALRGLSYLTRAMEISDGDLTLTLAGYNGGHSVIEWDPSLWPEETWRYVYWGSGILDDITAGLDQSPRLMEWLSNGGESLCRQAASALGI